jgi:hypothetical protein
MKLPSWWSFRKPYRPRKPARTKLAVETLEDRLTPANLLVSTDGPYPQELLREYTPQGQLINSVVIPPGGPQEEARDLVATSDGNIHVYNGTFDPYLSTYSLSGAWTHRTHPGWSTVNSVTYGGLATFGDRIFATDMNTSGDTPKGIVWFDRFSGAAGRFATTQEFIDLNVGLDGKLYALTAFRQVYVYDAVTFAHQRTVILPTTVNGATEFYRTIAVNEVGDIFAGSTTARVLRFNTNGIHQQSTQLTAPGGGTFGWVADVDVSTDGFLAVGSHWGHVTHMTQAFTNATTFTAASYESAFVTFTADQGPPPPPTLAITDASVTEGSSAPGTATFTVILSSPSSYPVSVNFESGDGTASAFSDYLPVNGVLNFEPGQTSKTVSVTILADTEIEGNETFLVRLFGAVGAPIGDDLGTGTIVNDDFPPSLYVNDVILTEGNAGTTNASFVVSLSQPATQTVSVNYTTTQSSATAGVDYQHTAGTLTFAPGETSKTVHVPVFGDVIDEFNEYFWFDLSSPVNASISDWYGQATIVDDDTATFSINDVSVVEGNSGPTAATFTVSLSGPSSSSMSVNWAAAGGSATAGSDFTAASGTLTFSPGETSKTVSVSVLGDTLDEPDETFTVTLSGTGAISDNQGVGTILDDDLPALGLAINDVTLTEGNSGTSTATFTVTLSAASTEAVTVDWATANNTAWGGADYLAAGGTLTFAPGETSKTIDVTVLGEQDYEINETFFVNLSNPVGAGLIDAQGIGTIVNDDTLPLLSVNDVTVTEGNSGSVNAVFTLTLSGPYTQSVTANYNIVNNGASNGSDYSATTPGTVTFAPGETSKTVTIAVLGDTLDENNEAFNLEVYGAANAGVGDWTGVATITDDDSALLSVSDVSVTEGHTGTITTTFTISLSTASDRQFWVNWATANGTATAGSDYNAASGTVLTFNPGQTSRTVSVTVLGDNLNEGDETFALNLSGGVNSGFADPQGIATIVDDDALPIASISDVSITEGNSGSVNASFTVSLHRASTDTVTLDWATADGTAGAADYAAGSGTLTFAPGETSKTVSVAVLADLFDEPNETFYVDLANAGNAAIGDARGVGTILDDDEPARLAISDASVTEGNAGTTNATFTVTLTGVVAGPVTVNWATGNSSAVAGSDFVAANGTLTFAVGETSKTITVAVIGETVYESNEIFRVDLSNPTNATFQDFIGIGTIVNDDLPEGVSVLDVTVTEGDSSSVNATFTVVLSSAQGNTVWVNWRTWAVGAAAVSADFANSKGTLVFAPGETTQTVVVPILADVIDEADETFTLVLSNPVNIALGRSQALGTILDNDPTAPPVSRGAVARYAYDSNGDGVFEQLFTGDTSNPLQVSKSDTYPQEYRSILEFNVSSINLSSVGSVTFDFRQRGYTFGPGYELGTVEIYGYVGNGSVTLADATAPAVFLGVFNPIEDTGSHSVALDRAALLSLASSGSWVGLRLVGVTKATMSLDPPSGFNPPMLVFHTHAAPPIPTVSIADATEVEGSAVSGGYTDLVFVLTLSQASNVPVSVTWTATDGTALVGQDYANGKGLIVFNPGETQKTITVRVIKDLTDEADETLGVQLLNVSNATLADASALGTILDDDEP